MTKVAVVYKIKSKVNGLEYIGSTKDWVMRKSKHKSVLKKDKHPNNLLQGIFNKHGLRNLSFTIVEKVNDVSQLEEREQHYMDTLKPELNIKREAYSGKARKTEQIKDKKDKRIGNQFWKQRSKHGRDKLFKTPELMWEAACEYFQWCDENPLKEGKIFSYKGEIVDGDVNLMRAYTLTGLCLYMDCDSSYFRKFKSNLNYNEKDFFTVIKRIEETIYTQKFEGAAAGLLNANIIARDLGLSDKKDITADITSDGEKIHNVIVLPDNNRSNDDS